MPTSTREKILLASIPVIGTIIITVVSTFKFNCHEPPAEDKSIQYLKVKAGKINDMIVFDRYNDLLTVMPDPLRMNITKELFEQVQDSIKKQIGNFVKPIDTSYSAAFGNENFLIKNQYQSGTNVNEIIMDKQGNLVGFYSLPLDKR